MLVEPLKLTAPVAAFNGGMYVKSDLTTVLAQKTIPPAVAREVVDSLLRAGLDVWVYRGTDWFIRRLDAFRVAREQSNVRFDPIVIDDLYAVLDAPVKIVGVSEDHAAGRALRDRARRAAGRRRVSGAFDAVLRRRHTPRSEQGDGGARGGAHPPAAARRDRDHRGHGQRHARC